MLGRMSCSPRTYASTTSPARLSSSFSFTQKLFHEMSARRRLFGGGGMSLRLWGVVENLRNRYAFSQAFFPALSSLSHDCGLMNLRNLLVWAAWN